MRRHRGSRFCSAAAAAAARRCCSRSASASAARPRSTSTSSGRRRHPSGSCRRSAGRDRRSRRRPARSARAPRSTRRSTFFTRARARPGRAGRHSCSTSSSSCARSKAFPACAACCYDFVDGIADSGNRFVLSSRYTARDTAAAARSVGALRSDSRAGADRRGHARHARRCRRRAAGRRPNSPRAPCGARRRPAVVRARARRRIAPPCATRRTRRRRCGQRARGADGARRPHRARCSFCYELRLHRARGYGALKAILEILADEEGLTLTEISQRLQRTPGSTKDYLSWLEDVDLVVVATEALQLHRPAAARLGAPPLPAHARRPKRTSRAKCIAMRCRACRSQPNRRSPWRPRVGAGRRRPQGVGHHRDRLTSLRTAQRRAKSITTEFTENSLRGHGTL